LETAYGIQGPAAVRYPRGRGPGVAVRKEAAALPVGRGEIRRQGRRVALLAFGSMVAPAEDVGRRLDATVVNMRFVKPLDEALVLDMAARHELLVTVEENALQGGAGSAVAELLHARGAATALLQLGLPDRFIEQGSREELLAQCGLDPEGIERSVRERLPSIEKARALQ